MVHTPTFPTQSSKSSDPGLWDGAPGAEGLRHSARGSASLAHCQIPPPPTSEPAEQCLLFLDGRCLFRNLLTAVRLTQSLSRNCAFSSRWAGQALGSQPPAVPVPAGTRPERRRVLSGGRSALLEGSFPLPPWHLCLRKCLLFHGQPSLIRDGRVAQRTLSLPSPWTCARSPPRT